MEEKELGQLLLTRNEKKIYANGDVITKVFDHNSYKASGVLKEAMNQAYAIELGLPAPKLVSVFKVGEDYAISSEYIKGKTMRQLMDEEPKNKKKYVQLLVHIQLELLSILTSNLKLPKLKDKLNSYISESGLDGTTRFELHARLEKMPNHYKLCHGDICPENIVIMDNGDYYILDWAHAARGNASADAAMTYLLILLEGDEEGANMYLKEFCKKSSIDMSYVYQWISVVSATKLAVVKDEEKRAILLRNINVVEY